MVASVEALSSREIISSELIPQNRIQAYNDLQREYTNISSFEIPQTQDKSGHKFNRFQTFPNGFAVFQAVLTREDFNRAGVIEEISDNVLGKSKGFGPSDSFRDLQVRFEPNFYGIVSPDRNIGAGVNLLHQKVKFAPEVIKTTNPYKDAESLEWLMGVMGEDKNGERINDPLNIEHVQHEWGIARSLLNVINTAIKTNRIQLLSLYKA